ncbi:hypothetical protein [Pseudoblastomonas halimionae]|uniref:Uncharacterized protein n=1 Tax=Alteriqipengyuania halimionae TaxID=1926630 RepID=A0A6I4U0M3_9SPHN|nr:hypothetical protein [Alteriqipengyuania halimionae]MXP09428.1 hypothetical protein [Alteriqipengyuania halimionae]
MKKFLLLAACASLAACGGNDTDETATIEPAEPVAEAPAPVDPAVADAAGTFEMTAEDGTVMMRTVNADGTYTSTVNGEAGEAGTVRMSGNDMCYDPEGPDAETCWTAGDTGANGTFTATGPDGETLTVRRTN